MKAVIMAGGQGTRFWPLSRRKRPKQFLTITGRHTLLQQTLRRLQPALSLEDVYIVSSAPYLDEILQQLPDLDAEQIILEPAARNTAPCVGLAAAYLQRKFPEEVMVILPSDHVIQKTEEFHQALHSAGELAREDWLITFGIEPSFPATGYGYLQRGEPIGHYETKQAYRVIRFVEKPDLETANLFLSQGDYLWNSGMFVWSIKAIMEEIERSMPVLFEALVRIGAQWEDREEVTRIFSHLEKTSIDYGVMERARQVATIPCDLGWSDVGNWNSLRDLLEHDTHGIASNVAYEVIESSRSLVFSREPRLVVLVGVHDLIVVDTPDALLVCSREETEKVKKIVEQLERCGLEEYL